MLIELPDDELQEYIDNLTNEQAHVILLTVPPRDHDAVWTVFFGQIT